MKTTLDKKFYKILFILILLVSILVRGYKLGIIPAGVNQDGAMAAVDAKSLAIYATDRYGMVLPVHLTAWKYGQMSALLSYIMVPFIKLFGLNTFAMRLPVLIVSVLGLIFLYLLSKDLFDKNVALIILFIAAINPWHILQSRWALDCNLFPHFIIAGVYFLNLFKNNQKRKYLIISMFIFGLSMYCYGVSIYTVPPLLLFSAIYLFKENYVKIKDIILAIVSYLFIAWPFILTMIINFLKLKTVKIFGFTIPYFKDSVRSNDILFFSNHIIKQIIFNFKCVLKIILQFKDDIWNSIPQYGTMYLFSLPLIILGLIIVINKRKENNSYLIIILIFICLLTGIFTNKVNTNRINIIYYPFMIFNGVGLFYLLKDKRKLGLVILGIYCISFTFFVTSYFTTYNKVSNQAFYSDLKQVLTVTKDIKDKKFYITANSKFYGSSNVSEILTLFYHDIDAKFFQGKTKDKNGFYYRDKYHYVDVKNMSLEYIKNAVYIIKEDDKPHFSKGKYKFKKYGEYYVVE